ncbi:MAG TPA: hypothetical protein VIT88_02220 [Pyrinomonadaceae bacterium]
MGQRQPFSYTIAFRNSGDVAARAVLVTDELVEGFEVPIPGARRGFYFNISSQLSSLFDLFGASRKGLTTTTLSEEEQKDKLEK